MTPQQARDVIPVLPTIYDEPFADSSQIPTFLVSQLARGAVTVALSGDGGDEIFCGYRRYFPTADLPWPARWITEFLDSEQAGVKRGILGSMLTTGGTSLCHLGAMGTRALSSLLKKVSGTLEAPGTSEKTEVPESSRHLFQQAVRRLPLGSISRKVRRVSEILAGESADHRYVRNATHWPDDAGLVWTDAIASQLVRRGTYFHDPNAWPQFADRQQRWQWLDTLVYLPDDILTKVDRASMSVSLEARTPLLDHRVVEFAWTLPLAFVKSRANPANESLRDVLAKYIPRNLFERPKVGRFGVPTRHTSGYAAPFETGPKTCSMKTD